MHGQLLRKRKMAEADFKRTLTAFILTSLFAVLIIGAVVTQGNLYERDTTGITGGLSYFDFNESINTVESSSQNLRESFEKQNIFSIVAGIVVTGIFDIAKTMVLMIILPFTLIARIMTNIFFIPRIVTSVMLGLLVLSIILAVWKLLKTGE